VMERVVITASDDRMTFVARNRRGMVVSSGILNKPKTNWEYLTVMKSMQALFGMVYFHSERTTSLLMIKSATVSTPLFAGEEFATFAKVVRSDAPVEEYHNIQMRHSSVLQKLLAVQFSGFLSDSSPMPGDRFAMHYEVLKEVKRDNLTITALLDLSKGLLNMHRDGRYHQDIHEQNIMKDNNGGLKLIDAMGVCHAPRGAYNANYTNSSGVASIHHEGRAFVQAIMNIQSDRPISADGDVGLVVRNGVMYFIPHTDAKVTYRPNKSSTDHLAMFIDALEQLYLTFLRANETWGNQ